MIRSRFHRRISWLAFLAMALLVAMPTAGRLVSAWSGGMDGPQTLQSAAMATHHGDMAMAAMMTMAGMHGDTSHHAHDGSGPHQHFGICAYCPLLACLTLLALCLLRLLAANAHGRPRQDTPHAWYGAGPLGSIGARGPPRAL